MSDVLKSTLSGVDSIRLDTMDDYLRAAKELEAHPEAFKNADAYVVRKVEDTVKLHNSSWF